MTATSRISERARRWEPEFAIFVEGLAFAGWLAGVGLGAAIRRSEAG